MVHCRVIDNKSWHELGSLISLHGCCNNIVANKWKNKRKLCAYRKPVFCVCVFKSSQKFSNDLRQVRKLFCPGLYCIIYYDWPSHYKIVHLLPAMRESHFMSHVHIERPGPQAVPAIVRYGIFLLLSLLLQELDLD